MSAYQGFAECYDILMKDVDYSSWADYIEAIFRKHNVEPCLVLDLACGTGSHCIEMSRRGYEMIGIDLSADMLAIARDKAIEAKADILFVNQNMSTFELYGTVDAITCLMDSVNYITSKRDLEKMLKLVKNYLNPGGLFIFDINSAFKLENTLGDNVFYQVDDDISYIWQNSYNKKKCLCRFDLTFFVRQGDCYKRFDETHFERAYAVGEITEMIKLAGLEFVGAYGGFGLRQPAANAERIFFVCRRTEGALPEVQAAEG